MEALLHTLLILLVALLCVQRSLLYFSFIASRGLYMIIFLPSADVTTDTPTPTNNQNVVEEKRSEETRLNSSH